VTEITRQIADFLKATLSVREVVAVLSVASVVWLAAGVTLRGRMLVAWLLVPVLVALACFCIAGQEHLFPNRSFEGPHLIRIRDGDAITLSDLIGVALGAIAFLLALILTWQRIRKLTD